MSLRLTPEALARLQVNERTSSRGKYVKNFIDPRTGEVYSKRQVQTARNYGITPERKRDIVRAGLWDTVERLAKKGKNPAHLIHSMKIAEKQRGKKRTLKDIATSPEFWQEVKGLLSKSTRPHGKLARALELLGYREEGAEYPVGDSPKREVAPRATRRSVRTHGGAKGRRD